MSNETSVHVSGVILQVAQLEKEGFLLTSAYIDVSAIRSSPPPATANSPTRILFPTRPLLLFPIHPLLLLPTHSLLLLPTHPLLLLPTHSLLLLPTHPLLLIAKSPIYAAANSPTPATATENAHTPAIYCLCRQRCATKRCPCKGNRIPCGLNCHPGRNFVNTVRINTGNPPVYIDLTCNDRLWHSTCGVLGDYWWCEDDHWGQGRSRSSIAQMA